MTLGKRNLVPKHIQAFNLLLVLVNLYISSAKVREYSGVPLASERCGAGGADVEHVNGDVSRFRVLHA